VGELLFTITHYTYVLFYSTTPDKRMLTNYNTTIINNTIDRDIFQ